MNFNIACLIIGFFVSSLAFGNSIEQDDEYDVVIYGGTASAVIAAVEISKSGKVAVIVSPDNHLGGLSSGGLGFTDTGDKSVIGGLARDFYQRVYQYYLRKDT